MLQTNAIDGGRQVLLAEVERSTHARSGRA